MRAGNQGSALILDIEGVRVPIELRPPVSNAAPQASVALVSSCHTIGVPLLLSIYLKMASFSLALNF